MAQFKFEGNVEGIGEVQYKLVETILQKQGFQNGKIMVEPVGEKGDNYVAKVVRFLYEKGDGSYFAMVCKLAPTEEVLRKLMNIETAFRNEIIMYEEVIPKFIDLQNQAEVPADERVRFPVCYGTLIEAPYETILLEDLKEAGFDTLDRTKPLSDNTVRLTLKSLATYHSLSYALKDKEPETYKNAVSKLINTWIHMDEDPGPKMYFEKLENDVKSLMENEKHKKVITGSLSQIPALGRKLQPYEQTSRYSVIQQGDCWSNNILFKIEEGKESENVMIDYQMAKECNPVADILYFVFNCTDYALRAKYFHEWIDYYHKVLDHSLENYGLKSKRVYPRDQLDADLRRYGKLSFGLGIMLSTMLVRESKDVVDMKDFDVEPSEEAMTEALSKTSIKILDNSTISRLKEKVVGLIDSSLELGFL